VRALINGGKVARYLGETGKGRGEKVRAVSLSPAPETQKKAKKSAGKMRLNIPPIF